MSLHDSGFQITYAGHDLLEISTQGRLNQGQHFHHVYSLHGGDAAIPGAPFWEFWFTARRQLPPEGDVFLLMSDGMQAEGQARLDRTGVSHSFFDCSEYSYVLRPYGEARRIIHPETEAIKNLVREREARWDHIDRERRETELLARITAFSQIKGDWTSVACYSFGDCVYDHFNLKNALSAAIETQDWGEADSVHVACDGVEIFSNDDLWTLAGMKGW